MAVNKVQYGDETLIDLTSDSVTPDQLVKGATAHDKAGNPIAGAFSLDNELAEQDAQIATMQQTLADQKAVPSPLHSLTLTGNGTSVTYNGTYAVNVPIGTLLGISFWTGSRADYASLPSHDPNTLYIITGEV